LKWWKPQTAGFLIHSQVLGTNATYFVGINGLQDRKIERLDRPPPFLDLWFWMTNIRHKFVTSLLFSSAHTPPTANCGGNSR
jgi:hypothetical protein